MPAAHHLYRGGHLPFTRGYAYRPASTQANEIDRNLMFYYEHLNLYDPRRITTAATSARTSTSSDDSSNGEGFRERPTRQDQLLRERRGSGATHASQVDLPPSPPRTPTPTQLSVAEDGRRVQADSDEEEAEEDDEEEREEEDDEEEREEEEQEQGEERTREAEGRDEDTETAAERQSPAQQKEQEQHDERLHHHQEEAEFADSEREDDSDQDSDEADEAEADTDTPTTPMTPMTPMTPLEVLAEHEHAHEHEYEPTNDASNLDTATAGHRDDYIHRLSTDAPPSYRPPTIHPPSYLNHHTTTLLESNCPPALTENLRRFLLFSLAIDYDLVPSCPEPLDQADWLPFLRLARHWAWRDSRLRYMQGYDPVRPAFLGNPGTSEAAQDDERALRVEQCIFAVVVRPAIALGVPADIATTTLRQFPTSITSQGTYLPLHHRYRSPSTKSLATKLLLDREILFDTITQHHHQAFRSALHEANERIAKQVFKRLRSPDDYELTQFGLMREKLEGRRVMEGLERSWGLDGRKRAFSPKGRKRFSRWVRKLSST